MNTVNWISWMTLIPVVGAGVIPFIGSPRVIHPRTLALLFSVISSLIGLKMWGDFETNRSGYQFVETYSWIPSLGINYQVGVDGLGIVMVLLTSLVLPFSMAMGKAPEKSPAGYYSLMLCLHGALIGAFTTLNFFHWFLYWELSLIPAFFIVRLWGGSERKAASTTFFVYTMVGSISLLLAMLAVYLVTNTFDFAKLSIAGQNGTLAAGLAAKLGWLKQFPDGKTLSQVIFLMALLGFAIKVPLFPFHSWLPDTYSQAPSSTTMVLTGVMSKLGIYGMLRILLPIFPDQASSLAGPLSVLAVLTIVLSALAALRSKELKSMLAYTSINHLGYCLLGVFALATPFPHPAGLTKSYSELYSTTNGIVVQILSHGLIASSLFGLVAIFESRKEGCPNLDNCGGLRSQAPVFTGVMGLAIFASLGLPGLSGFVGEFLILNGAFAIKPGVTALATLGLLISAIAHLNVIQRIFCGPLHSKWSSFLDLTTRERLILTPVLGLIICVGLWPRLVLDAIRYYRLY